MYNRPCPICNSKNAKVFMKGTAGSSLTPNDVSYGYDIKKLPQVVKCLSCELLYVSDVPENILDLYKQVKDKQYHQSCNFRKETFRNFLSSKEKYAPAKGALLDVGCATGLFMETAREAGYMVTGIEPNDWAREICRNKNLNVYSGELKDLDRCKMYDCITMWDVIEHVIDPVSLLTQAWAHLNTGGCILITTPDAGNVIMRVLGQYHWLFTPWHLTYFDSHTIVKLVESLRKPRYVITTAPPYKSYFFKSLSKLNRIPIFGKISNLFAKIPNRYDFPVKLKAALLIVIFK